MIGYVTISRTIATQDAIAVPHAKFWTSAIGPDSSREERKCAASRATRGLPPHRTSVWKEDLRRQDRGEEEDDVTRLGPGATRTTRRRSLRLRQGGETHQGASTWQSPVADKKGMMLRPGWITSTSTTVAPPSTTMPTSSVTTTEAVEEVESGTPLDTPAEDWPQTATEVATIKCHTFSEPQARPDLNDDDNDDINED